MEPNEYSVFINVYTNHAKKVSTFGAVIYHNNALLSGLDVDVKDECGNTAGYLLALYDAFDFVYEHNKTNGDYNNLVVSITIPNQSNKKYTNNIMKSIGAILSQYRNLLLAYPDKEPSEMRDMLWKAIHERQHNVEEKLLVGKVLFQFVRNHIGLDMYLVNEDKELAPFVVLRKMFAKKWNDLNINANKPKSNILHF